MPYPSAQAGPHVYGPNGSQHGHHVLTKSKHGHSHSADYREPHAAVGQKPDVQVRPHSNFVYALLRPQPHLF